MRLLPHDAQDRCVGILEKSKGLLHARSMDPVLGVHDAAAGLLLGLYHPVSAGERFIETPLPALSTFAGRKRAGEGFLDDHVLPGLQRPHDYPFV